jgi:hypothetical protein
MQRNTASKTVHINASKPAAADQTAILLTEGQAAEIMWIYYRDHKAQLINDIKLYRSGILTKLMEGLAVEHVFAPFVKPAAPAKPLRRAA